MYRNKGNSLWNFVPSFGFRKFSHGTSATNNSDSSQCALSTSPGDDGGGRGQVSYHRQLTPVDHTQRPVLCTARWARVCWRQLILVCYLG